MNAWPYSPCPPYGLTLQAAVINVTPDSDRGHNRPRLGQPSSLFPHNQVEQHGDFRSAHECSDFGTALWIVSASASPPDVPLQHAELELLGGLWHTTNPERFNGILATGAILPKPDISYMNDWRTLEGTDYCSYVRKIGGVSLFDFDGFDPEVYSANNPSNSWYTFVPYRDDWGVSVWIEIDREAVAAQWISCIARWKSDKAWRHAKKPRRAAT